MRLVPVLLVAALVPLGAQTGTPANPLTLQDAISLAQQHGPSAEAARSQRDAARYRNNAFNARLLPQLVLSGNAADLNHGINPITLPDGSTQFIGQSQNQSSMELGFQQRIPLTGGLISVGSGVSRIDEFGNLNSRYWQTSPVVVRLEQDLFKPREVVWNERVQSLNASVAERGYLEAREDVAQLTADAFFNLYAQQIALANATANVAVNDTLYTLAANGWSAPAFFTLTGGTWGAQIGAQAADVVMLIMNDKGMQDLLSSQFKLGGEAAITAGPVGREATANTDWKLKSEVLTYSRTRGLFAGLNLSGALVKPDDESTQAFYNRNYDFRSILTGQVHAPAAANPFLAAVRRDFREAKEKS